jgi:hypothetical protein
MSTLDLKPIRRAVLVILLACLPVWLMAEGPAAMHNTREHGSLGANTESGVDPLEQVERAAWSRSNADSNLSKSAKLAVNLDCSVVDWKICPRKPVLTLACPGDERGAQVRVYLKLSWLDPHDQPENYQDIVAPSGTATKLHSDPDGALVLLKVREAGQEEPRASWISFNELVNLELQGGD